MEIDEVFFSTHHHYSFSFSLSVHAEYCRTTVTGIYIVRELDQITKPRRNTETLL